MYSNEIKEGEKYPVLKKAIVIVIAKFEMKEFKEIPKFHTEWIIQEKDYRKTILTDVLEIHIIELPKLEKMVKRGNVTSEDKKLALWSKFLLDPESVEEKDMKENKDIKKAKEELDKIKQDEYEKRLAELRQKKIWDDEARKAFLYEEGLEKGREEAQKIKDEYEKRLAELRQKKIWDDEARKAFLYEEGLEKGLEQGRLELQKEKQEIVKKMLKSGFSIEDIIKITELSEEEIEKIKS